MKPLEELMLTSRDCPCPICGDYGWCGYNSRLVICMRTPSNKPTKNGGWVHYKEARDSAYDYQLLQRKKRQTSRKSDKELDVVYRRLLQLLPLSERHRLELLKRGLTDESIAYYGYRTLPAGDRSNIVEAVREDFDVYGIPGFGLDEDKWVLAGSPGLLIPVYSPERRLVAFQIRPDRQQPKRKYVYLSSSWLECGSSPGVRIHLALPVAALQNPIMIDWVTEGPLKADIAAQYLKARVWAVPGVSNWRGLLDYVPYLTKSVCLAFDNDKEFKTREIVRYHINQLACALSERGLKVYSSFWRGAKGLDDALVAGITIQKKYVV